jgi:hypothetical protein
MIWRLMRWLPRTGQAGQVPYISLQGLETQLCQNAVIEILQMQSLGLDGQDLGVLAFSISSFVSRSKRGSYYPLDERVQEAT